MSNDLKSINKDQQEEMQRKEKPEGQINLGGREFTGASTDQETSSTGLPTMGTNPPNDERDNKNSETPEKS